MTTLENKIQTLKSEVIKELKSSNSEASLEELRVKYLGRSGILADLMSQLKPLSLEEKRVIGPRLNKLKVTIQDLVNTHKATLEHNKIKLQLENDKDFDVTAYKAQKQSGSLHPYTYAIEKLEDIFITMGYEIVEGPEVEDEFHNFTALNIPHDHPARDMQDTFWLNLPNMLMRTHTSSVQIHTLKNRKPPFAIAALGRAYRNEATDASHDFMFMQTEILYINKTASLAELFGTIQCFLSALFDTDNLQIRTRPSYFPFTEPSIEVDMSCPFCIEGCSVCKQTCWIELGGAGLVHPNVLKAAEINPQEYSGFAFGFGLTRLVMLKYNINDIRLLNSNRLDFLKQF